MNADVTQPTYREKDRKDQEDLNEYLTKAGKDAQRFSFCNWSLFLSNVSVALVFMKKSPIMPEELV